MGEPERVRRQRSLQYFTSSQQRSHFLRQANGRPQTGQTLEGRSDFFLIFMGNGQLFVIIMKNSTFQSEP